MCRVDLRRVSPQSLVPVPLSSEGRRVTHLPPEPTPVEFECPFPDLVGKIPFAPRVTRSALSADTKMETGGGTR